MIYQIQIKGVLIEINDYAELLLNFFLFECRIIFLLILPLYGLCLLSCLEGERFSLP